VYAAGAAWRAEMRIVAGVEDLVQRIEDSHTGQVLGGWMIGRSGDAVYGLHHARADGGARISWLSLKTKVDVLLVLWPQNHWDGLSVV
jgi:hypothetical protein